MLNHPSRMIKEKVSQDLHDGLKSGIPDQYFYTNDPVKYEKYFKY